MRGCTYPTRISQAGQSDDSTPATATDPSAAEDGEEQPERKVERAYGEDTECTERQRATQHTFNSQLVHEGRGDEWPANRPREYIEAAKIDPRLPELKGPWLMRSSVLPLGHINRVVVGNPVHQFVVGIDARARWHFVHHDLKRLLLLREFFFLQ